MKVLVTGGAGYLGSTLARVLLNEGHEVRILDSLMYGGQSITDLYLHDHFTFIRGDIRDVPVLENALEGMDALVHLAAIVGDPACARQPDMAREINQYGAIEAHRLSRQKGVKRFLFASTCSNYGKMADPSAYVDEESELGPVSLYAETKVAVERHLLDSLSSDGPAVTIMRFATLFGISSRMRFDLTVNTFTRDMLTEEKLEIYGEQFWRPYIHVLDASRAIALVLSSPEEKTDGKVFNVGDTDENYQKGQLVTLIQAQTGNRVRIEHVDRQEDPRDYRVSFDKIKQELGFRITRTVKDGVTEIVDAINQGVITEPSDSRYGN